MDLKLSPCCNDVLVTFISMNKKMCNKCHTYFEWDLKQSQPPLFDSKHN